MKKQLLLGLLILGILGCQNNQDNQDKSNQKVILQGQIKNPVSDSAIILNLKNKTIATITLDSAGYFADTLHIPAAYYQFHIGNQYAWLYLKPGQQLDMSVDYRNFDQTLHFSGKGADINNYLAQKTLLEQQLKPKISYKYYGQLNEKDFIKLTDSIQNSQRQLLKSVKNKRFKNLETLRNQLAKNRLIASYPMVKQYLTHNETYQTSKDFPVAYQNVNINDTLIDKIPNGLDYINSFINYQLSQNQTETDPYEKLKYIDQHINNQDIKNELVYKEAQYNLLYTKKLDNFYQLFQNIEQDSVYKAKIKVKYDNIKSLQPGEPSPDFTAYDINGKEYHLKDFAGKALYIDLWATWCAPCRAELPYLDQLKKQYKGQPINFVSFDVYDQKDKWVQMLNQQKMTGWQLINTDRDLPFLKKYVVDGIPRFILLDKNGHIVDANAPRPSQKRLISLLDKTINVK